MTVSRTGEYCAQLQIYSFANSMATLTHRRMDRTPQAVSEARKPATAGRSEARSAQPVPVRSNQVMQRRVLPAKLKVNRPGDEYDREADRGADTVMRMPDTGAKPEVVNQVSLAGSVQRACACGGTSEDCRGHPEMVQRRSAVPVTGGSAPPIVHDVIRSPGHALDAGTGSWNGASATTLQIGGQYQTSCP